MIQAAKGTNCLSNSINPLPIQTALRTHHCQSKARVMLGLRTRHRRRDFDAEVLKLTTEISLALLYSNIHVIY